MHSESRWWSGSLRSLLSYQNNHLFLTKRIASFNAVWVCSLWIFNSGHWECLTVIKLWSWDNFSDDRLRPFMRHLSWARLSKGGFDWYLKETQPAEPVNTKQVEVFLRNAARFSERGNSNGPVDLRFIEWAP